MSEAEIRDSSVEMLQTYLTSIIDSIVASVDQCPPVMRVAFKQLHKRVEEQFSKPENEVSLLLSAFGSTFSQQMNARVGFKGIVFETSCLILTGRKIPGHQWILLPAVLCSGYPHAKTVPLERPAR